MHLPSGTQGWEHDWLTLQGLPSVLLEEHMSYGANASRRRWGVFVNPVVSHKQFQVGMAYSRIKVVLGDAAEDLGFAVREASLDQKVEIWQAWEAYFCG